MVYIRNCFLLLTSLFIVFGDYEGFAASKGAVLTGVYALLLGDSNSNFKNDKLTDIIPREQNFRPLAKKRFIPFSRQMEYLQLGSSYNDITASNLFVIDPLEYNYNTDGSLPTVPEDADDLLASLSSEMFTLDYKKIAANGMLDDDIQDEVAVVCWPDTGPGTLLIINPQGPPDATTFAVITTNLTLDINNQGGLVYDYDITTGDVDGDGYDEIIIAGSTAGASPIERVGKLWVVNDIKENLTLLHTMDIRGVFDGAVGYRGLDQLKVTSGNIDQDWADEIAIAFASVYQLPQYDDVDTIYYQVFDDSTGSFSELYQNTTQSTVMRGDIYASKGYFNIAMGDMDRDGRDEIAIGFLSIGTENVIVEIIDDALGKDDVSPGQESDTLDAYTLLGTRETYRDHGYHTLLNFFDVVDIDGDFADEIFLGCKILDDVRPGNVHSLREISDYEGGFVVVDNSEVHHVTIGDVNGDLREDISILFYDSIIQTIGYEEVTTYDPGTGEVDEVNIYWRGGRTDLRYGAGSELILDQRGTYNTGIGNTILISANVDNDSTVIEYSADKTAATPVEVEEAHTTYYGHNQIIAVLASPPAIDNINTDGSSTSFGMSSTHSVGVGAEASIRAGVLVGMEAEVQSGFIVSTTVAKFEAEVEAEIETTISGSTSASVTKTITYTTGDKEDRVIFSTTPYDRYQYIIASHPDAMKVGKGVTIDVPQGPKVLSWSKDYYNNNNNNQLDIGSEILQHTPGDILSYPTLSQKDDILLRTQAPGPSSIPLIDDGLWWLLSQTTKLCEYPATTVQQGGGFNAPELALEKETVFAAGVTGSVNFMGKACGATVCAGVTGGFSIGVSSQYTLAEGITFSGSVSGIPGELWESNYYEYGIFGYKQTLTDDATNTVHDFIVVNYWVQ